ncbi:MAG: glycosyltransferase family 2 protein [Hypericibacter sp.]
MRYCAIVPSHDHHAVIGRIVDRLREAGLPVFVIDDGSGEPARSAIAALHDEKNAVVVTRLEPNRGKGAAVIRGFELALQAGFTHAVQVDADGQHDLDALPQLLAASRHHPEAVICGRPVYDRSIPLGRRVGHWITDFWVWIETLSFRIVASMCGFRVYPLAAVKTVIEREPIGQRMDFDTGLLVRLFWRGTPPLLIPVKVIYPPGNSSNFKMLADNWRITRMHTRLVITMLLRLPSILAHRPPRLASEPSHWSGLRERGALWGLRFTAAVYRLLGRQACEALLVPVVAYFYGFVAGREQREGSRTFLTRALGRKPGFRDGYRHFFSFASGALDTFAAWTGGLPPGTVEPDNAALLKTVVDDPRGALIVISHLGNIDLARALLDEATRNRLTLLVHTRHAANYNRLLREFRAEAGLNMIQVTEVGPDTAIDLQERVERGEWIVIAGDRTPVTGLMRTSPALFMGAEANFSDGPWILGSLLDCPVHLMFCLRRGRRYRLIMEPFAERVILPRAERKEALQGYVKNYAARLEHHARAVPYQWFNFFDFWAH